MHVGIVFGASDPRLNRSTQNNDLIHGENYLSFQLDISTRPAVIRIFRKGYSPEDHPDLPMATLEIPESVICEENKYAEHDFEIVVSGCQMEVMTVDGTPLETDEKQLALVSSPLKPVTERTHLVLNPTGKIMDTPVFPRLCQIGFLTDERTEAVFTHLTIRHYGGAQNIIFSEDTGATYSIFRDLNGVQVSGKQIPPVQSASVQLLDAKQALQTLRYRTPIWSSIFALIRSVVFPQISHFPRAGPFPARYSA